MLATIAGAIALIPGGGSAAGAAVSAVGWLLRCGTCLKILAMLAAISFTVLHVHREEVSRCGERIAADHRKAEAAAAQRDRDVAADLGGFFTPKLNALRAENDALQKKVNDYAKRKAPAAGAGKQGAGKPSACRLGDAAGLLRPPASR
ncbi:hypothetical protein IVB45_17585 [Bradyrhizobium sp. 4]|uniref:hypothetical protein n=1 Tax=unclassified Bradyrhizobium TaxID=2631580 RepID=UPI001FF7464F|nr:MULTISPECIES: hypothetical protein [unclassified Bradyrhizobium]MCK1402012.1 hypothetical protein [Bradyrhizobium sp. 39]MCK1751268.1 hypothetical protein [Bradyrhizobium sp. 135]UPJ38519.1 hypothetical protein IVB45_17585 [Bradyrhizobium sp. 4]